MSEYAGADWLASFLKRGIESGKQRPLSLFARAAADLIGDWQRGIYHIERALRRAVWEEDRVEIVVGTYLSTYDSDGLTRLVLLAHDRSIRVEIEAAAYRYLRVVLSPRTRDNDSISRRHPSVEQAVARHRCEFRIEAATP